MKKGFPNTFLGIPIGWKKKGEVGRKVSKEDNVIYSKQCAECYTILHVGIDKEGTFRYCPKCEIKTAKLLQI